MEGGGGGGGPPEGSRQLTPSVVVAAEFMVAFWQMAGCARSYAWAARVVVRRSAIAPKVARRVGAMTGRASPVRALCALEQWLASSGTRGPTRPRAAARLR